MHEKAKSSGVEYGYSEYDYGPSEVGISMDELDANRPTDHVSDDDDSDDDDDDDDAGEAGKAVFHKKGKGKEPEEEAAAEVVEEGPAKPKKGKGGAAPKGMKGFEDKVEFDSVRKASTNSLADLIGEEDAATMDPKAGGLWTTITRPTLCSDEPSASARVRLLIHPAGKSCGHVRSQSKWLP